MPSGDELRTRPAPEAQAAGGGGPTGTEGNLDLLRAEGERLLAAGDAAIDRVLSGDSLEFLRSSRQHGGE
jgi:hypothetical protein